MALFTKKMKIIMVVISFIIFMIMPYFLYFYSDISYLITDYFYYLNVKAPIQGLIIFCILQILVAICGILPAAFGAVTSGLIFGIWKGFLIASVATILGAIIAFKLSRSVLRTTIKSFLEKHEFLSLLENMTVTQGWKMVCILRISPILPFALTSYVLGFTELSILDYFLGTLASLPALLGYVIIGHLTKNGFDTSVNGWVFYIKLLITALAIGGIIFLISKINRIFFLYVKKKE
ncbi:MAG: VTT domain-containing protein [Acetobacter orientalis]|uniref:TVP38/TMEM64 family protein n=2 Tax=Acetobacter orientalis TaxID=146474 RepID=UPI0039E9738A